MKIAIAQQNYHVGNFAANTQKIIDAINEAKALGADIVLFSEQSVCGYPARDFLEFDDFIRKSKDAVEKIAAHCTDIAALIGAPERNPHLKGKDLFNSAFFLYEGKVQQAIHKTLLPTYDVFDENRYFEPAYEWDIVHFKGKKLAVTICEDIWNLGDNPLYRICPMDELMKHSPDVMLNLSASPFDYTHDEDRKATIKANVTKYKLPMFYCNAVGSQTEIVFDGASLVFDKGANLCGQLPMFEESLQVFELNDDGSINAPILEPASRVPDKELTPHALEAELNMAQIHDAIILGIRDYFGKMGFKQAIVASSGGIDSAVTLALAVRALGAENVRAVLLPSQFSTSHSVDDAVQLSKNLNNPYDIIPIKNIFDQFVTELKPVFGDLPFNVAEEN
ncbi:MAG TPA: nitrilase-related carbon-nitrogen hydrolase, partial [Phnomibacter sp.]|nr:nitrilase-related carbon-nitrogen hydrolase [Phnomibacter sp.]